MPRHNGLAVIIDGLPSYQTKEVFMKKAITVLAAAVAALGFSVCSAKTAIVAPNTPVSAQQISQYLGAPTILACLGTAVPEGYVITQYAQSTACVIIPGIPGVQMTFTNYEGLDTFTACSGSPYPKEGSEGGFVITANIISSNCVISNQTPGFASVFRSVESSLLAGYGGGFSACTNSQMPYGFGYSFINIYMSEEENPCHDGYHDSVTQASFTDLRNGSPVCAQSVRPPKNVYLASVAAGLMQSMGCGGGSFEESGIAFHGVPFLLSYQPINGQSEIRVCPGWGPAPEGYVQTGIDESGYYCAVGLAVHCGSDGNCSEGSPVPGPAHIYKLPIYTVLP